MLGGISSLNQQMSANRLIVTLALVATGAAASAAPEEVKQAFKNFITKYDRKYSGPEEEARRFKIFEKTYNFIKEENAKVKTFFLVINEFADQAGEEFNSTHFGMTAPPSGKLWAGLPRLGVDHYSGAPLPESVDWVEKGAVNPVKNQGTCGSCWAFSTVAALEGAWQLKSGKLVSLSEQQLVDCVTEESGCSGGSMDPAFKYLKEHNACLESSYAYTQKKSPTCLESKTCKVGIPKGEVTGFYDVPVDDTKALMEAVAQQPVSVGIEADQAAFQQYGGGIITKKCGKNLDHGVVIVGYGTESGVDYWKVRNSWGDKWGEKGYVRIERGVKGDGECGIKAMASYPTFKSSGEAPAPTPAQTPVPTPTPSADCKDDDDFCDDKHLFVTSKDCPLISGSCKKTCGCCDETPKSWCKTAGNTTVIV